MTVYCILLAFRTRKILVICYRGSKCIAYVLVQGNSHGSTYLKHPIKREVITVAWQYQNQNEANKVDKSETINPSYK